MKNIQTGNLVKCTRHDHPMSVIEVDGYVAVCQYFVDSELYKEFYFIDELDVIAQ